MATELDAFPSKPLKACVSRYDRVLNGKVWRLVPGEDFSVSITSCRASLAVIAARRGLKLRTQTEKRDGAYVALIVQAYTPNGASHV